MEELEQTPRHMLTPDQRIRVFVSSTFGELDEERRAVKAAIKELKLHPVLFEDAARPYPPREVYKNSLEQSQIYLGVFWESYGWIVPRKNISGIEDEYNLSVGKPRLVYIKEAPKGRDPRLEQLLQRIEQEGTLSYKTFKTVEELVELIQNDIMLLLSERFGLATQTQKGQIILPDYLGKLDTEIQERGYVQRSDLISEIKDIIENNNSVVIFGNPGIGKTFLVGSLGTPLKAVYISLRNKTSQQVCSYLANRLALNRGQVLQNLLSEDEARFALQQELANSSSILLVDDCDQNQPVVQTLLSLDFYSNKTVYITRIIDQILYQDSVKFEVPPLNRDNLATFLSSYEISLPPGEFERLFTSSQGNPLYLFYFTQYQLTPLPDGLHEYQQVLWNVQPALHKDLMNFLAFSFKNLRLEDFHALLNAQQKVTATVMETKAALEASRPLITQLNGSYEFFHPYFEEYVISVAQQDGLDNHYHTILGEHSLHNQWLVPTTYHFLRAKDDRYIEYLQDATQAAILQGEWQLAEEFALRWIDHTKQIVDKENEAFATYLLAQIYQELGRYNDAREQVSIAIQINEEIGNEEGKEFIEIWASTLLIESGEAEETIEILNKALEKYKNKDDFKESYIQVNLSFAYIQKSLFREGAEAAQRALELSQKLGIQYGIDCSLVNLAGCVGHLGDRDKQRMYAEQIIAGARKRNLPRQVAAGLNQLAIVQRLNKEYVEARQSLEEAISICQRLGSIEPELSNIGNLGNVFRDQHLYDEAESAYNEYLIKAREHNFERHEARALELLAHTKYLKDLYDESIDLNLQALTLHTKYGDHLRIASTQDDLSRSYLKLNRQKDAAISSQEAGRHYKITGLLDDAAKHYLEAANLWSTINDPKQVVLCTNEGLDCAISSSNLPYANDLLLEISDNSTDKFGQFFLETLKLYLKQTEISLTNFIHSFSAYCKKHYDIQEKIYFKKGIEIIIKFLEDNSPTHIALNALAVALEQADTKLLPNIDFKEFVRRISSSIDHLHYRFTQDDTLILTVGLSLEKPIIVQIHGYSDQQITHRIAFGLALILLANKEIIESVINEFDGNKEDGLEIYVALRDEMEIGDISIPIEDKEIPVSVTSSNVKWGELQPPAFLFLHEDYEQISDWAKNPGNKALIAVLMFLHRSLIIHCAHIDTNSPNHSTLLARRAGEFCDAIL